MQYSVVIAAHSAILARYFLPILIADTRCLRAIDFFMTTFFDWSSFVWVASLFRVRKQWRGYDWEPDC